MFARKPTKSEILLVIDDQLRFFLFGLQLKLDVEFCVAECERVYSDAKLDQVSEKHYTLYKDRHVTVTGRVDGYESESIWIIVDGPRVDLTKLETQAKYEILRIRKANGDEHTW